MRPKIGSLLPPKSMSKMDLPTLNKVLFLEIKNIVFLC
jgi:hypothetical protein